MGREALIVLEQVGITSRFEIPMKRAFVSGCLAMATGCLLVGCGSNPCLNTDYNIVRKIGASDSSSGIKFLTVPDGTTEERLRGVASSACGSRWCKLLIWEESGSVGRSLPLTQEQVDSQLASYVYNPQTDSERLLVRREEVPMGTCSNRS